MQKSVLITGGAARIGKALSLGLAQDGWAVAVHYNRSKAAAEAVCAQIAKAGGQAVAVGGNLAVPFERDDLLARAGAALSRPITALINNASTFSPDAAGDFSPAQYDHHFDVNLKAPLLLSQQFANTLPKHANGVIINMIDQRVLRPAPDFFTYGISKSALFAATHTMAQTFAPRIRVCGVGPGATLKNTHQSGADFAAEIEKSILKTGSPPDTILQAVRYLLAAKAVTGQMIAVDGGEHLAF